MEFKTIQKALEKEIASTVAQDRVSESIGTSMVALGRAMEEQRNVLSRTAQSLTRQFTEPILASNAVAEMIRRVSTEHYGVFTRLHASAAEEMAQLAERVTASSPTIEAIRRSATKPWFSNASQLAEMSESVSKNLHEGYMSSVEKMIANLTAQASSCSAVGSILAEQQAKAKERLDGIQSSSRYHLAGSEDFLRHIPSQLPTTVPPGGASEFMQRVDEHFHDAITEAEETGGRVVMKCSLPGGEVLSVSRLSLEDDYFVSVEGRDERGLLRNLKVHFNAVLITIEVVFPDQLEKMEDDDMPVN